MSKLIRNKKLRYGTVSILLTALLIAAVILFNAIFYALAVRYLWYYDMTSSMSFSVTDDCYEYIDTYIEPQIQNTAEKKITFLFCDEQEYFDSLASGEVQYYLLKTAKDLAAHYDFIEIAYLNIWEKPSEARKYDITASTNVSIICGDRHATYSIRDFFTFSSDDSSSPTAYNGEARFAAGMMRVTQAFNQTCYFTLNHGEALQDIELLRIVADAGYNVSYLDLLNFDIPEDCGFLIIYNPTQDLTEADSVSSRSEVAKLNAYMENGGKMMFFAGADTFVSGARPHLEGFLADWGISYRHHYNEEEGVEYCANVRDIGHSTSTDGYTILADYTTQGNGADILADLREKNAAPEPLFSGATCIDISQDYHSDGAGNYVNADNGRVASVMLTTGSSAEIWEGGQATAHGQFNLLTVTTDSRTGAYLFACSSVGFAAEDALQSAVLGNSSVLLSAIRATGKENIPTRLTCKPFDDTDIDSITTAASTRLTLILTVVPTLIICIAGVVILVRRKHS